MLSGPEPRARTSAFEGCGPGDAGKEFGGTMSIKTILLHMAADEDHDERLRVGLALARRFGAFVDILYTLPEPQMPVAGRGASTAFLAEAQEVARERAAAIAREVRALYDEVHFAFTSHEGDASDLLAERSLLADLAVISQAVVQTFEDRWRPHTADRLPGVAACPTLVLPHDYPNAEVGHRVLLAWTPTRAAARALHAGLPILKQAERVVAICGSDGNRAPDLDRLRDYLRRHGITAEVSLSRCPSDDAGATILAAADGMSADLIVMGAYSHARWREILFGGTTRDVLLGTRVPLLLAN